MRARVVNNARTYSSWTAPYVHRHIRNDGGGVSCTHTVSGQTVAGATAKDVPDDTPHSVFDETRAVGAKGEEVGMGLLSTPSASFYPSQDAHGPPLVLDMHRARPGA